MLRRIALLVLMWSISAVGAEESPADPPVVELEVVTVTATKTERFGARLKSGFQEAKAKRAAPSAGPRGQGPIARRLEHAP